MTLEYSDYERTYSAMADGELLKTFERIRLAGRYRSKCTAKRSGAPWIDARSIQAGRNC